MGLEDTIRANSLDVSIIGFLTIAILIGLSKWYEDRIEKYKGILFGVIVFIALTSTFYLVGATVYLNNSSQTKGPVHWHADFEIWRCGQQIQLKSPSDFLSNKIGTAVFHEHGDKRIHVEGAVVDLQDVTLGNFFKVIGGNFDNTEVSVPINAIPYTTNLRDTASCDSGVVGRLQVFLYKFQGDRIVQEKLSNPKDYILSPQTQVPPGDCIIIELDAMKDRTEKMCKSYEVAIKTGKFKYD